MTEFAKYHKVPAAAKIDLPAGPLVLQHKLDGSQAGIERAGDTLLVHSRNTHLATIADVPGIGPEVVQGGGANAGFAGLVSLVAANFTELLAYMQGGEIDHIYGEWLVKHKVTYPEEMYRKFYVYDILKADGVFHDPRFYYATLKGFGFQDVHYLDLPGPQATHAQVREGTLAIQAAFGGPIEGAVLKSYALDAEGAVDRYGNRYVYKDVLPDYHEIAATDRAHYRAPLPTEQALAESLPERAIEKRYLDVVAANGGQFEGKLIPQILRRVWADFLGEYLAGGLRDLKHPVVNTDELKRLVDARTRTFALEYTTEAAD